MAARMEVRISFWQMKTRAAPRVVIAKMNRRQKAAVPGKLSSIMEVWGRRGAERREGEKSGRLEWKWLGGRGGG